MIVSRDPLNPFRRTRKPANAAAPTIGEKRIAKRALSLKPEIRATGPQRGGANARPAEEDVSSWLQEARRKSRHENLTEQGTSVSRLRKKHGQEVANAKKTDEAEDITAVGHLRDDRLKFVPLPPDVLNPKKPKENQYGDLS